MKICRAIWQLWVPEFEKWNNTFRERNRKWERRERRCRGKVREETIERSTNFRISSQTLPGSRYLAPRNHTISALGRGAVWNPGKGGAPVRKGGARPTPQKGGNRREGVALRRRRGLVERRHHLRGSSVPAGLDLVPGRRRHPDNGGGRPPGRKEALGSGHPPKRRSHASGNL